MLRRDYMVLTEDACAALLLQVFEEWTNWKLKQDDPRKRRDEWIWQSVKDLSKTDLCEAFGKHRVTKALERLKELGFVERRPNPDVGFDRTYQYRLRRWKLQAQVDRVSSGRLDLAAWAPPTSLPIAPLITRRRRRRSDERS